MNELRFIFIIKINLLIISETKYCSHVYYACQYIMHEPMEQPKALCYGVDINFNDAQFVNHQLFVVFKTEMI